MRNIRSTEQNFMRETFSFHPRDPENPEKNFHRRLFDDRFFKLEHQNEAKKGKGI